MDTSQLLDHATRIVYHVHHGEVRRRNRIPTPPDFVLVKVGQAKHLQELIDGRLWMPRLSSYWGLEDGGVRGDPLDGLSAQYQANDISIRIGPLDPQIRNLLPPNLPLEPDGSFIIPSADIAAPVRVQRDDHANLHAFCMTHHSRHWATQPDLEKLCSFGDKAVAITDPISFLRRVGRSAHQLGLTGRFERVTYGSIDSHHGAVGPWFKANRYAWQQEARLCVQPTIEEVLHLDIGPLEGLAAMYDVARLAEILETIPA